jgi:glycosyltransferase involved in cell wall biosynthesis
MEKKVLSIHPWLDLHPAWQSRTAPITRFDAGFYQRSFVSRVIRAARIARRFDACVLFQDVRFALVVALLLRLTSRTRMVLVGAYPLIVSKRGPASAWEYAVYFAYRGLFSLMDRVVVHSGFEISTFSTFFKLPAAKFQFVPYFLRDQRDDQRRMDWEERWRSGYVLCAGRHRDVTTFVEAVDGLGRKSVVVAGKDDEPRLTKYEGRVANLELHYEVSKEDYGHFLDNAALIVLPFYSDLFLRSLGQIAFLEASRREIPVVTSRTPHLSDYVREGEGVMCYEAENTRELREMIALLLSDRDLARSVAHNAHERVKYNFTRGKYVDGVLSIVDAILVT